MRKSIANKWDPPFQQKVIIKSTHTHTCAHTVCHTQRKYRQSRPLTGHLAAILHLNNTDLPRQVVAPANTSIALSDIYYPCFDANIMWKPYENVKYSSSMTPHTWDHHMRSSAEIKYPLKHDDTQNWTSRLLNLMMVLESILIISAAGRVCRH